MKTHMPTAIKILSVLMPLFYMVSCVPDENSKDTSTKQSLKQEYHKNLTYPLVRIGAVPQGATISRYTNQENIADKISYNGASEILASVNPTDKRCFIDPDYRPLQLRVDRPMVGVDFNKDGKMFGQDGENVGEFTFRKFPKFPRKPLDSFVVDVEERGGDTIYVNAVPKK